jgi:4-alpha-glucanotransferase
MVKALHAAGIEVILDVVYNHTCEGNQLGPTLSLRGIDNVTYYWLMPESRYYLDFTGTGNSVNASNPETARLIVDSLRYWVDEMHVDGFRFDLASTMGRVGKGQFDRHAPIFQIINQDPILSGVKLIAEPWDTGLGGYQVGNFPAPFREWNGKFRDAIRRYWKGDENLASELGNRISGSADLFQGDRRQPQASINFVTAHDGFTLNDLVSYNGKHNEANGENNQDGADDNHAWNHGHEGESDDPEVLELRARQQRNLLASLLLSQGVPMLLGGDEMGRSQAGNNNAYCQDNAISWFDWKLDERRRRLFDFTRQLIALRRRHPVLQRRRFFEGDFIWESASKDLAWLRPDGAEMSPHDWQKAWISTLGFMLGGDAIPMIGERGERLIDDDLLVLMNAHHEPVEFQLPIEDGRDTWLVEFDTADPDKPRETPCTGSYPVAGRSLVLLRQPLAGRVGVPVHVAKQAERRRRRAGVVIPLSAIRSESSWGVGEIADLPRFARWARSAGLSVVQLLPVHDVSTTGPSPYAPVSAFALDPAYLSLDACEDFVAAGGQDALPEALRQQLAAAKLAERIDWSAVRKIKRAGIQLAFERFLRDEWNQKSARASQLGVYMKEQRAWLDDYALFSVLHARFNAAWTDWPHSARDRDPGALASVRTEHRDDMLQVKWLQWQLDSQWRRARREVSGSGVELMGDQPFTVAIDSADVWSQRDLFRLDRHVASPPDATSPTGHDWGLPVFDWGALMRDDFSWVKARAMRTGELYGLCRVDHVIGLYRTYYRTVDGRSEGFTPHQEANQLLLGETLLHIMSRWTEVIAEDLGMVPAFLRPSLERLAIPGYRVLRWEKDGEHFREPHSWPSASVATVATHDTESLADWYDALSVEERRELLQLPGLGELAADQPFDERVRDRLLAQLYAAPSTLALFQFQDLWGRRERINTPGRQGADNWTFRSHLSVEQLATEATDTERLARLARDAQRQP